MLIIVKRALQFFDPRTPSKTCTVMPKSDPQEAPDWIRETETFKAAVRGGELTEIGISRSGTGTKERDGWEKITRLGEGGQGEVFLARNPRRAAERHSAKVQVRPAIGNIGGHSGLSSED